MISTPGHYFLQARRSAASKRPPGYILPLCLICLAMETEEIHLPKLPHPLPTVCDTRSPQPNLENAVALVIRGESFRGFNLAIPDNLVKRAITCRPNAYPVQRALARLHVKHIVEPLEARGIRVDIFLATYGCVGVLPDDKALAWHEDLISWYGEHRVKRADLVENGASSSQQTTFVAGLEALQEYADPVSYRSLLVWRFDLLLFADLASPSAAEPRDESWPDYLDVDTKEVFWTGTDYAFSVPGWFTKCFIAVTTRGNHAGDSESCFRKDTQGHNAALCTEYITQALYFLGEWKGMRGFPCRPPVPQGELVEDMVDDEPMYDVFNLPDMRAQSSKRAKIPDEYLKKHRRDREGHDGLSSKHSCPKIQIYRSPTDKSGACNYLHSFVDGPPCDMIAVRRDICLALKARLPEVLNMNNVRVLVNCADFFPV
ncbi:hypothetical protein CYMTET_14941 [Cymbomonas tetramitiformis]|uniref:Uncharacterized protein n=1 Tax=Cymbomonas tetramitiformis TaxID=36881 RepID=A0AAE0GGJ3_9CHLO|nr:hypothetical protein CYMTET_14941 [Cymbomonas tetramitiformis]